MIIALVAHACTMIIVHAGTMIIVQACTMIIVHACAMIMVHACALIVANACTSTMAWYMYHVLQGSCLPAIEARGLAGRCPPQGSRVFEGRRPPNC